MKEILIPLNFTTTPTVYDTKQSFSTSDEASGVLTFTTTADVTGTVASLTIHNASENANRQTVLIERLNVNRSPFSYAFKNPLPFGQYEGTVLLKKNMTVIASASFLFGVNSSLSAEVLPDLVKAFSLDELVENVETEVSNLKDAFHLTVSETVKGVNKTESSLQAQENVRYLNEHQRKANERERIANENARLAAEVERKDTFDTLVDSEVIEQTVVQEVANEFQQIEATYANRLLSTEQQLAEAELKSKKHTSSTSITNGKKFDRKPIVSLTFDDAPMADYNDLKPVMDSYGVKGTIYAIGNKIGTTGNLTIEHLKTFYDEGWEIGSHTASHSSLASIQLATQPLIGDLTIRIQNSSTSPFYNAGFGPIKCLLYELSDRSITETITITANSVVGGIDTATLSTPIKRNWTKAVIRLHPDQLEDDINLPRNILKNAGITCTNIAYPWGGSETWSRDIVAKNFATGRGAYSANSGINGGFYDGSEEILDGYKLNCTELANLTTAELDGLVSEIIAAKGWLILLGHSTSFSSWESKLVYIIEKCQTLGIEILPVDKALEYHHNLLDLGGEIGFKVGHDGSPQGGFSTLKTDKFISSENVGSFPIGISSMRSLKGLASGFPTNKGTLLNYRTKQSSLGTWGFQYWYDEASDNVWYRKTLSATTFTPFKKITKTDFKYAQTGSLTIPANSFTNVEMTTVTVTNSSSVSLSNYTMPVASMVLFTPYVSAAKLYVRIYNLHTAPITADFKFQVAITETS